MKTARRRKKRTTSIVVYGCCYSLLFSQTLPLAYAGPTGAEVTGGSGTISQSGNATTIHQSTENMSINWQSYNVGVDERVQYVQPNASSVSLNRILSNNGSTIAGRIDANGRVILVNPNGLFFTPTAVLNVGSLIASGLDINPADFMNGNGQYIFNSIEGTSGTVINSGLINASVGGNIALVGKQVKNDGVIVANLGTVSLAAGKETVLTFDNDGLLGVRVSKEILQSELGVDAAVINSGTIQAQGGKILLTASQSQDIFSRAVNTQGIEQATSAVVNEDGSFTLGGGADVVNSGTIDTSTTDTNQNAGRIVIIGENVTSSGTIKADAQHGNGGDIELHARDMTLLMQDSVTSARSESNGKGGIVKVLGDKVGVFDQSRVDVSGANGGGQALIGGDFQGKNTNIRNASTTIVHRNTDIFADALQNGDGGKVILWADGTTYFGGDIFVRGGTHSGNGGYAETSGKENLLFRGAVDRTAANGKNGLLLLDPRDINIVQTGSNNGEVSDRAINFTDGTASTDYTISASTLQTLLEGGDVTLEASEDINVNFAITATANALTTPNELVLRAVDDIAFNEAVNLTGVKLSATAGYGCTANCAGHQILVDASGQSGSITANGANVELTSTGNIILEGDASTTNSGAFTATAGGYFDNWFANQNINTGSGAVNITANSAGTINKGSGNITAAAFLGDISAGTLSVTTTNGAITQSTAPTQNLAIAGNATFNAGTNAITLDNADNALAGTITLGPTPSVPPAAPVLGGNVSLRNSVATTLGTVNAAMLTVRSDSHLTLSGPVTATGTTYLNFGRSGADSTFTVNSTPTTGGLTIDGDAGADTFNLRTAVTGTLNGTGGGDTFNIAAPLAGTVNGGDGADTFNIGSSITGTINGNAGNDDFNITAAGVNITSLDGGTGNDTLTAYNGPNTWLITGDAAGSLNAGTSPNTGIAFSRIQTLIGGTNTDTFTFTVVPATANMTVNGGTALGIIDTVNLNIPNTAVNFQLGASGFTDIEAVNNIGTGSTGTLIGANTAGITTWNINATNGGSVNDGTTTTLFGGFRNLTGGTGTDRFVLATGGSVSSINGGTGTPNTLVGQDTGNTWTLDGDDSGSVAYSTGSTSFSNIANVNGGIGTDTFTLSGSLSGLITGGTGIGSDTLTITAGVGDITVELGDRTSANLNVYQVETIRAAGGNNTLIGDNATNTWTISGTNSGDVTDGINPVTFTNFATLTGGSAVDRFTVNNGATIATLNGGLENDRFTINGTATTVNGDAGNDTVTVNVGGNIDTVNLGDGNDSFTIDGGNVSRVNGDAGDDTFTLVNGNPAVDGGDGTDYAGYVGAVSITVGTTARGLEGVNAIDGNGTLNAQSRSTGAPIDTTWTIDGTNSGGVTDTDNQSLFFTGFSTLNGGAGDDDFIVTRNTTNNTSGQITGAIHGNGGTNVLTVTLTGSETGQVNYIGSTGNDTVTAVGTTGTYNGIYAPGATTTDRDQLAYTSTANATYYVNYTNVDTVQTDRTLTTLTVNGSADSETLQLNNGSFIVGTHTEVGYNNVTNLTVNGQAGTDTVNLNNVNLPGTLTLAAETVTGNNFLSSPAVTANTLILDNVGQFGSDGAQLATDIDTLTLINTGAVHINEGNGLNLNTTGTHTNAGQFTVTGITTINTGNGGSLTLDNAQNDFDTVNTAYGITAAAITLRDRDRIEGGNIAATAITLNTATGVGSPNNRLQTHTDNLMMTNSTSGGVYVTNDRALQASITNRDDIDLANTGDLVVERLHATSGNYNTAGDVILNVTGAVSAYTGPGSHSAPASPDIIARNLRVATRGDFGTLSRSMSIRVDNTFSFFGARGYVFYFGGKPEFVIGAKDLVVFSGLTNLTNQQLIEIESLEDIDPAIFTAVRNYYYEDVAIMMPREQFSGHADEEEGDPNNEEEQQKEEREQKTGVKP